MGGIYSFVCKIGYGCMNILRVAWRWPHGASISWRRWSVKGDPTSTGNKSRARTASMVACLWPDAGKG